jgi:hypothetical protein
MNSSTSSEAILRDVLDRWKAAVDAHESEQVGALFTEDAIFRGCIRTASGGRGSPTSMRHSRSG